MTRNNNDAARAIIALEGLRLVIDVLKAKGLLDGGDVEQIYGELIEISEANALPDTVRGELESMHIGSADAPPTYC